MQWNGIKVHIVALALLVGLGALWGGQWAFKRFNYERPLDRALGENKEIASFSLNNAGADPEVQVKLKQVNSLEASYQNIQQSVDQAVNGNNVKITVTDNRDKVLEGLDNDARLAAYEALNRGNYLEMSSYIQHKAAGAGAKAQMALDQDSLYIQIDHGDKYLYDIIPRPDSAVDQGSALKGGGQ